MSHREMREELTCPICMEFFSLPRRLPCGHSYCHDCIKAMLESKAAESGSYLNYSRPLICPECRDEINIDFVRGIEGLPVDFKLSKLVDLFQFMKASDDSDNGGKSGLTKTICEPGDPANTMDAHTSQTQPLSSPLSTAVSIQPLPTATDHRVCSSDPYSSSRSGATPSHLPADNHPSLRPSNAQQFTASTEGNAAHRQGVNSTELHSSIVQNSVPDRSLPAPPITQSDVEEVLVPTTQSVASLPQHVGNQEMGDAVSNPNRAMERLSHTHGSANDVDSQHLQTVHSNDRPASTTRSLRSLEFDSLGRAVGGAIASTPLSSFTESPESACAERLGGFTEEQLGERRRLQEDAINEEEINEDECVVFEDDIRRNHSHERDEFGSYRSDYVAAFHHSPHRHHRHHGASMSSQLSASLPIVGKKRESVSSDNSSVVERCISRAHSVPVESKRDSADGRDSIPPVLGNTAESEDVNSFQACGEQNLGSDVYKNLFNGGQHVPPRKQKQMSVRDDRWFPDSDSSLSSANSAKGSRWKEKPRMVRGRRKKWLMTRFFRSMFLSDSSSSESDVEDESETGDNRGLHNRRGTNQKGQGHKTHVKAAPQGQTNDNFDMSVGIGVRRDCSNSPTSPGDVLQQQAHCAIYEGQTGEGAEAACHISKDKPEERVRKQESYESNGDFAARRRNLNTLTGGQEEVACLSSLNSRTELKDVFPVTDATLPNLTPTRNAELDSQSLHPAGTLYDNVGHSSVFNPLASPSQRSGDGYDNVTLNSTRERCVTDEVLVRSPDFNPCREPCSSAGDRWRNSQVEEHPLPSCQRVDPRTLYDNLDCESVALPRNYSDSNILPHQYVRNSRLHSHSETDIENLKTGYECSEERGQCNHQTDRGIAAGHVRTFENTPRTSLSAENISRYSPNCQLHRNSGRRGEPLGCAADRRREYYPSSYCNVSHSDAKNSPVRIRANSSGQFHHFDHNAQQGNAASSARISDNVGTNEERDMGFGELSLDGETACANLNIPNGATGTCRNIGPTGPAVEERELYFVDNHFNNRSGPFENRSHEPSASCEKSTTTISKTISTNKSPPEPHANASPSEPVIDRTSKINSQILRNSKDERRCENDKFDDGDSDDSSSAGASVLQVKKKPKSGIKRFLTSLLSLSSTSSSDDEMDNHNDKTSSKSSDW